MKNFNFQLQFPIFLLLLAAVFLVSCNNSYDELQPGQNNDKLDFRTYDPDTAGQIHNGAVNYVAIHADSIHSNIDIMDQIFDYIYSELGFYLPDSVRIYQATDFHDTLAQYLSIADYIDQHETAFLPIEKDYLITLEYIANDTYGSFQGYIDEVDDFIGLLEAETDTTFNKSLLFGAASIAKRSAEYWYDYNTTTGHVFENIAPYGKSGGIYLHPCTVVDILAFVDTYNYIYPIHTSDKEYALNLAYGQAAYESIRCIEDY